MPSTENRKRRCHETLRQLNEYIDGELADDLCQQIEQHMADCHDCQLIVDTLSRTIKLYRTLAESEVALPADVESRLFQKLNNANLV